VFLHLPADLPRHLPRLPGSLRRLQRLAGLAPQGAVSDERPAPVVAVAGTASEAGSSTGLDSSSLATE
jgi:hypothetical protein